MSSNITTHTGKCHCGSVKFQFKAPSKDLIAWDCNCSICSMKRNTHIIIPKEDFSILQGESNLTEYQFNTKTARHLFCSTCGVCPFYVPRSNPDSYAVTLYCVDPGTIESVRIQQIDGMNWERAIPSSGIQKKSMVFG